MLRCHQRAPATSTERGAALSLRLSPPCVGRDEFPVSGACCIRISGSQLARRAAVAAVPPFRSATGTAADKRSDLGPPASACYSLSLSPFARPRWELPSGQPNDQQGLRPGSAAIQPPPLLAQPDALGGCREKGWASSPREEDGARRTFCPAPSRVGTAPAASVALAGPKVDSPPPRTPRLSPFMVFSQRVRSASSLFQISGWRKSCGFSLKKIIMDSNGASWKAFLKLCPPVSDSPSLLLPSHLFPHPAWHPRVLSL